MALFENCGPQASSNKLVQPGLNLPETMGENNSQKCAELGQTYSNRLKAVTASKGGSAQY